MGCRELPIEYYEPTSNSELTLITVHRKKRLYRVFYPVVSNYRFYSPEMGRWTKRDDIGESGGVNLYGMVSNDAINW